MLPPVRGRTAGDEPVPVVDSVHAAIRRAPLLARPVLAALSVALLPWLLAPICVFRGVRTAMASLYVAAFCAWVYFLFSANRLNTRATPTVPSAHQVATIDQLAQPPGDAGVDGQPVEGWRRQVGDIGHPVRSLARRAPLDHLAIILTVFSLHRSLIWQGGAGE